MKYLGVAGLLGVSLGLPLGVGTPAHACTLYLTAGTATIGVPGGFGNHNYVTNIGGSALVNGNPATTVGTRGDLCTPLDIPPLPGGIRPGG